MVRTLLGHVALAKFNHAEVKQDQDWGEKGEFDRSNPVGVAFQRAEMRYQA